MESIFSSLKTLFVFFFFFIEIAQAQSPQGMAYQAVVRDASGSPVINAPVGLRFSILQESSTGTAIYVETQSATTSGQGLVTLTIGKGRSTIGTFAAIDWASGPFFLKVEVDLNNLGTYPLSNVSQMQSVPYALYAQNSSSSYWTMTQSGSIYPSKGNNVGIGTSTPNGMLEVKGTDSDPSVPLFEVKDINGNSVFAVYPDGVEVTVDMAAKGRPAKGGFAVSGRNSTRGTTTDIMRVTPDSTTVYIGNVVGRPAKGGFAVSGRNSTRAGLTSNILTISPDSTRIYTADPTKGFGIGQTAGVAATNYLRLTPNNYFIGQQTGYSINKGQYNVFLGYQAGYSTTGYHDDMEPTDGDNNIFIGYQAGFANTVGEQNLYIGAFSGKNNTNGSVNTFVGSLAGQNNTGYGNTFLGAMAGGANQSNSGYRNTFIGCYSGLVNTSGSDNVFIGRESGRANTTGNYNVYIGHLAGLSNSAGTGNVFIGRAAGQNETGSNKLYIANNSTQALMQGDFSAKTITINGNAFATSWSALSDGRLKSNIVTIPNALSKVLNLRGVNFAWKDSTMKGTQMGFIAQEAEKVIPEVVNYSKEDDKYTMQYAPITALLVEAMKEQQKTIDQLKKDNEELRKQVQEILDLLKSTK